jgi:hypothetical protein
VAIVQIAGTYGSGKSTIVRGLFDELSDEPQFVPGRRVPIGHLLGGRILALGSYADGECGGCDTIRDLEGQPEREPPRDFT